MASASFIIRSIRGAFQKQQQPTQGEMVSKVFCVVLRGGKLARTEMISSSQLKPRLMEKTRLKTIITKGVTQFEHLERRSIFDMQSIIPSILHFISINDGMAFKVSTWTLCCPVSPFDMRSVKGSAQQENDHMRNKEFIHFMNQYP